MDAKIVKWRLNPGGKDGQMKREELYRAGLGYIEKLKDEGENVLDVQETENEFTIILEDK